MGKVSQIGSNFLILFSKAAILSSPFIVKQIGWPSKINWVIKSWSMSRCPPSSSCWIKGETRFRGRIFQRVCAGFPCMTLHFSKAWFHDLASIRNNLATYPWYTVTVTTHRSHHKMPYKGSKRQHIWRCAKPNVDQCMHYWASAVYLYDELSIWI